jgi:activating signal cointegrator complex subunit 2
MAMAFSSSPSATATATATATALPLELRQIDCASPANGVRQKLPALHKAWADCTRNWVAFRPAKAGEDTEDEDKIRKWCQRTRLVADDLDFLLGLEHHAFWSQLVFDASLQPNLVRILQFLPRKHDTSAAANEDPRVTQLTSDVMRKVFLVFARLSTPREAPDKFISPEKYGNLIYDNFLLDIPRLLDLCVLFRHCSPKILSKMVASVFKHRPSYAADLYETVGTIIDSMSTVVERTDTIVMNSNLDVDELSDMVVYATDLLVTVDSFLQIYPPAAKVFFGAAFDTRLASFYYACIVVLCKYLARQKSTLANNYVALSSRLQLCRLSSVSILRQLVEVCCIEMAIGGNGNDGETGAENFLLVRLHCYT